MGLFDVLSYGSNDALGTKVNYRQYYQDDVNNQVMMDKELTRIETEVRDTADRMKRVQLTTGKGVNAKLQSFYDGLTQELKTTISKNPNYKTDPIQMQAVNAVMDRFASNDIIANDAQSKATYQAFKEQTLSGKLTAREIAEGENRWKRYQDGVDDIFSYTNAKKVDYSNDLISAAAQLRHMNTKAGNHMLGVSISDTKDMIRQKVGGNAEYLDQALTNFKNLPLEERAHWMGMTYGRNLSDEQEAKLGEELNRRFDSMTTNGQLSEPLINWLADEYHPYTNQQWNQWDMMNQREAYMNARAYAKHGTQKLPPTGYFKGDFQRALQSSDDFARNQQGIHVQDLRLNGGMSLFPMSREGKILSSRMVFNFKGGKMVMANPNAISYLQPYQDKQTRMRNAQLITVRNGDSMSRRLSVGTAGLLNMSDFRNFLAAAGFTVKGGKVYQYAKGKNYAIHTYPGVNDDEAMRRFLVEEMGATSMPVQMTGLNGNINPKDYVVMPYHAEVNANNLGSWSTAYDQEVYEHKNKSQMEADAAAYSNAEESYYGNSNQQVAPSVANGYSQPGQLQ